MIPVRRSIILGASFVALFAVDFAPGAPLGVGFVREAAAIVGMPLTPMSYAGVARRTTRRVVYTEAAVATTATAAAAGAAAATAAAAQPRPPSPPPPAGPVPLGTVVSALPAGCVATPIGGVEYYNCAPGVYYHRAAFQGNNLVYVAAQP
jgi:hypothetical protein